MEPSDLFFHTCSAVTITDLVQSVFALSLSIRQFAMHDARIHLLTCCAQQCQLYARSTTGCAAQDASPVLSLPVKLLVLIPPPLLAMTLLVVALVLVQ